MKRDERLERVGELASRLLDGVLGGSEREELNDLLRGDPEACELYLDLAESHSALLHDHVADELLQSATAPPPSAVTPFRSRANRWRAIALAAGVVLLLNAAAWWLGTDRLEEPLAGDDWVAVLSRTVDAEWSADSGAMVEGDPLRPGTLALRSGLAQIEFFSGASVIVEGPAELDLESSWLVNCRSGKLRTFVPEAARGFTIETPDYRAVDLGTEFALSVGADGESELHVVDGEVRLDDAAGREIRQIAAGGGIRSQGGEFESVSNGGGDFIDRRTLLGLAEEDWHSQYQRWASTRDRLRNDPSTLVLFDFENQDPWDRQLENRKPGGPKGAIIGARWSEGRWPGKGALEFKRITDRVRLRVDGNFDALTFAARVRVEGLDRWLSSLLLTDGFDKGEVHWQISDSGELVVGISTGKGNPNTTSPPVILPDDLGRWTHLAVTVDRESGTVAHYVDGEAVHTERRTDLPPLRIGDAEIGNWKSKGKDHPIRSFNGRIEEFVVLERALSAEEIAELAGEN